MVNTNTMTEEMVRELAFTKEDREELKKMKEKEIVFSDDCPEVTPQKAIRFKRVNPPRANVKPSA